MLRSKKKWIAATCGVAVIGMFAAVALGSPGSGVTPTTLVTANFESKVNIKSDGVWFRTKDRTDVRVQKLVFAAGGFSGWHHHPGLVLVAVESGEVTLTDSRCNTMTYGAGSPNGAVFAEGGDHPMQASSAGGATVYVTYVAPNADPPVFRIEDDPPPCA